nr:MAG TPA: hypothetical protein [Caudoviricetes sp.]
MKLMFGKQGTNNGKIGVFHELLLKEIIAMMFVLMVRVTIYLLDSLMKWS